MVQPHSIARSTLRTTRFRGRRNAPVRSNGPLENLRVNATLPRSAAPSPGRGVFFHDLEPAFAFGPAGGIQRRHQQLRGVRRRPRDPVRAAPVTSSPCTSPAPTSAANPARTRPWPAGSPGQPQLLPLRATRPKPLTTKAVAYWLTDRPLRVRRSTDIRAVHCGHRHPTS